LLGDERRLALREDDYARKEAQAGRGGREEREQPTCIRHHNSVVGGAQPSQTTEKGLKENELP
jgi:hypothetical protein